MFNENYDKVIEGLFRVDTIKNGEIIDTYEEKNKIMTTARTAMARNMTGKVNTTSPINRLLIGNLGHTVDLLTPKDFTSIRTSTFSESHQETPNVTTLGFVFDGVDTISNPGQDALVLKHNTLYQVTLSNGQRREFRKVNSKTLNTGETHKIDLDVPNEDPELAYNGTEPYRYPKAFVKIVEDMGLSFDGVNTITNNTNTPITISNNIVYLVTLTSGITKEFTKVLDETIPEFGGVYTIQSDETLDTDGVTVIPPVEPLIEPLEGRNFIVDFDSTDFTNMDDEDRHETIILASDGTSKSHKIVAINSHEGLPVAPETSGVNINVITEGNKATFKFTIPQTQGNGPSGSVVAYTEAALYCDEKIFSMKTFPARTKDNSLEYQITWVITF